MKMLLIATVVVTLTIGAVGCLRLIETDHGKAIIIETPSLTAEKINATADALDEVGPPWLEIIGSLTGIGAIGAFGKLWSNLKVKKLALAGATDIGADLVTQIQLIRDKAKAGEPLTLDDINAILLEAQKKTPEVVNFIEAIKAELRKES